MKNTPYQVVITTCPDNQTANAIAQTLVGEQLAACVNILTQCQSVYRWQGEVQNEPEQLLLIKSSIHRYRAIERRIRELHPYELPEIIAVPIVTGLNNYLSWLHHPV